MKTDYELITEIKKGDVTALTMLFKKHNNHLVDWLIGKDICPHLSEDYAQEAWAKWHKSIDTYVEEGKFLSWMCTTAIRTYLSYQNSSTIKHFDELISEDFEYSDKEEDTRFEKLSTAINNLENKKWRDVLILKTYTNLKFKEITAIMKIASINTSLYYYRKGYDKVKKIINAQMKLVKI